MTAVMRWLNEALEFTAARDKALAAAAGAETLRERNEFLDLAEQAHALRNRAIAKTEALAAESALVN